MVINNRTVQVILALVVSVIILFLLLWFFGVFQADMTFREQVRSAPGASLLSAALSIIAFGAVIFLTNPTAQQLEILETKYNVGTDFNAIDVASNKLQHEIDKMPKQYVGYRISSLIMQVVDQTKKYIVEKLEPDDITDSNALRLLYEEYVKAITELNIDIEQRKFAPDAEEKIKRAEEEIPKLLVGFTDLMVKVRPEAGGLALKNVKSMMQAWGYLDTLKIIDNKNKEDDHV